VQRRVILFCSMRRGGKSLGQMVKEESGGRRRYGLTDISASWSSWWAVLIVVVVHRGLGAQSLGSVNRGTTIPLPCSWESICGICDRGRVGEVSVIRCALLLLAVWGGTNSVNQSFWGRIPVKRVAEPWLAWAVILYGLMAILLAGLVGAGWRRAII